MMLRATMMWHLLAAGGVLVATRPVQCQEPARDTTRRSALAGVVRDTLGHPLSAVRVFAEGRDLTTVTDDSGSFHLRGIPSGPSTFSVMRVGYRAVTFNATLPPDSTIFVEMRLRRVQNLPEVAVRGERISAHLFRDGFYDRQKKGWGKYLSPEEVEKRSWMSTPSQMLRDVPGMTVRCRASGRCVVSSSAGCVTLFVDGVYTRGQLDDVMPTSQVYAIETYARPALVPMEFTRPPLEGRCGAVVVWTKSREPG